jgi:Ca2+-binding RTX toxin-like protein
MSTTVIPLLSTTDVQIVRLTKALFDAAPGNTYLTAFRQFAEEQGSKDKPDVAALANALIAFLKPADNVALADLIIQNLHLTGDAATNGRAYLLTQFSAPGANKGQVLLDALNALAGLGNNPTFGQAANLFNASVNQAYQYSINPANTTTDLTTLKQADEVQTDNQGNPQPPAGQTGNPQPPAGQTFTLTPGVDYADDTKAFNGANASTFRFTANNETVVGNGATFNNSDTLIDPSTSDNDTLKVQFLSTAALFGNAANQNIQNIETFDLSFTNTQNSILDFGTSVVGEKTVKLSGTMDSGQVLTLNNLAGGTVVDASGMTAGGVNVNFEPNATSASTVKGGVDNDAISGGKGADSLDGGAGNDTLNGGLGNDTLIGGTGNDTLSDSAGDNTFDAGAGNDSITAGVNNDNITAGDGNDTINGGAGNDVIDAGDGNDTINGGAGNDVIDAGNGNDTITGGAGRDIMTGGNGQDTFVFAAGTSDTSAATNSIAGVDLINDAVFNGAAGDLIDLTVIVANVNAEVTGNVSEATFETDMNTLLNVGGGAGFNTAVAGDISAAIVTVTGGSLNGHRFLAVDLNNSDTFTVANDFVIEITGSTVTLLNANTFV